MALFVLPIFLTAMVVGISGKALADDPESWPFAFSADGGTAYQLAGSDVIPEIRVSFDEYPGVLRAANDLAADFGRVLGTNATVVQSDWKAMTAANSSSPLMIIGTAERSDLLRNSGSSGSLNTTAIANKWETFSYEVIPTPWDGRDAAFVIAGSDMRGTIFGIYDVSERIGVSPWYWWADVPPTKRDHIYVNNAVHTEGPPSVKFRGIFFNDESPCLTSWGAEKFKSSQYGSPFVTDFYKRVFELVLRLKANYVWPAMWSSMFYLDDANNGPTATMYGVYMGTSHHEPMARADKEQSRFMKGAWDWRSNKANVQSFMQEGVTRSKDWSTVYTLGMRGSGDAASATLTSSALEEVIHWQQSALVKTLGRDLSTIPQAWVMYKEVPGYWQKGMNVSDDVTLLWSDDNRGNIRRIPTAKETTRRGGSGMYYHFDYVGDPRNYKWINSIQLQKTWEQMSLAYERGVQTIWIANVGDLKGLELPTAHFLAMAWDMNRFQDPTTTQAWLQSWSSRQFGASAAAEAAGIMTTYGTLTARRKYEDLSMTPFALSTANYNEAERNYAEWAALADRAQAAHDGLPAGTQPAFFELVLHPVLAGRTVHEVYAKTAIASQYAAQHRVSANAMADGARAAFAADAALTRRYHALLGGKWNHMMDQVHIGYTSWQDPGANTMPRASYVASSAASRAAIMGVAVQGGSSFFPTAQTLALGAVSPYLPPAAQPWLEVFARDNGTFSYTITSNVSHVQPSVSQGTIAAPGNATDVRSLISIDWTSAPAGSSAASLTIKDTTNGRTAVVVVPLRNAAAPASFRGHVEAGGVVSIEAEHHSASSSDAYRTLPDYGRTLSGVRLDPSTPLQDPGKGPALVYPFYTFSTAAQASLAVYLSPSENADPAGAGRFAFSINGTAVATVQPVPVADAGSEPAGWADAVVANARVSTARVGALPAGEHELRVWLLGPTMVLTKLVLDVGGLKSSALGPPESVIVGG